VVTAIWWDGKGRQNEAFNIMSYSGRVNAESVSTVGHDGSDLSSVNLTPSASREAMSLRRPARIAIRDLRPLDMPAHQSLRSELRQLSDEELLQAVEYPIQSDRLLINTQTGLLFDGNGRAYELLRRAMSPKSTITHDTMIPVEYYTPDYSVFPDMEP